MSSVTYYCTYCPGFFGSGSYSFKDLCRTRVEHRLDMSTTTTASGYSGRFCCAFLN